MSREDTTERPMNQTFMKGVLILLACCGLYAKSTAQDKIVPSKSFVDASFVEVIDWLESAYQVSIAYSKEVVSNIQVNDDFESIGVEAILKRITNGTSLAFRKIHETRYLIGPSPTSQLQKVDQVEKYWISGVVKGSNGHALPYANIFCSTDKVGGTSDVNGQFKIQLDRNIQPKHLKVSYIGYQTEELIIDESSVELEVALENTPIEFSAVDVVRKVPPLTIDFKNNSFSFPSESNNYLTPINGRRGYYEKHTIASRGRCYQ